MIASKLFTHIDMITEATKNCSQIIYKDVPIEKHLFLIYMNTNIWETMSTKNLRPTDVICKIDDLFLCIGEARNLLLIIFSPLGYSSTLIYTKKIVLSDSIHG